MEYRSSILDRLLLQNVETLNLILPISIFNSVHTIAFEKFPFFASENL